MAGVSHAPGKPIALSPWRGFKDSVPRTEVGLDQLSGPSADWLIVRGRLVRRPGSETLRIGTLESKWGALARRVIAATLDSVTDGYPSPLTLYTNEGTLSAALGWRSTNGATWTVGVLSGETWKVLGSEFSSHHYPATGVPNWRVVPMIYENEHGGVTLHRFNNLVHRQHALGGSRDVLEVGRDVCWPGYTSVPGRWHGRFNEATGSGSEPVEIGPLGMVPPLQMPVCTPGTDIGASTVGPFKGSNAFFFSVIFENDRGELSMFTVPRPPNSAWTGYAGFGFIQIDSANPTHYYDSVTYSFIPQGPAGTRWIHLVRSLKVDVATTGANAVVTPALDTLAFFARIPQGQTTYVDTDGNDLALDNDPRILEMWKTGGLQWPKRGRYMGRWDGHVTIGHLRPNPSALIIAPWNNGALNLPIDDAGLYGATSKFVAINSTSLILRSVVGGVATDTTIALGGLTLQALVDHINADASLATTTLNHCSTQIPGTTYTPSSFVTRATALAGVNIGDYVVSSRYPVNTKVVSFGTSGGYYFARLSNTALSDAPALAGGAGGEDFSFVHRSAGADLQWGAAVVPGADAGESTDSLLRTYSTAGCTYGSGTKTITVTGSGVPYITPGMVIQNSDFPDGTTVTANGGAGTITVSDNSTATANSGTVINFGFDTGDTTLALLPGFVRAFGNAYPMVCYFSQGYLAQFEPSEQSMCFTPGSPGYASEGVNTWLERNLRTGPKGFGPFMGFADMGAQQLLLFKKGRQRLWNPRTGLTHADADYIHTTLDWNRGCRSPYACGSGNGWAFDLSDDGLFVTDGVSDRVCISRDLYDSRRPSGSRGQLEYAIEASVVASDAETDAYRIFAQVTGSVLYVRYWSNADAGYPDREIHYDFSEGYDHAGLAEVLKPDGSPYPWSAPLKLSLSCSAVMAQGDGALHHYAMSDPNSDGDPDGRMLEIETGTLDDAAAVAPMGYSGTHLEADFAKIQGYRVGVVLAKAGTGVFFGLAQDAELGFDVMEFDETQAPSSVSNDYVRAILNLPTPAKDVKSALCLRIRDDGSGPQPDIARASLFAEVYDPLYKSGG